MLEIRNVSKRFAGMDRPALSEFSLELKEGEIVALAGASGSGKTTALRIIAGFESPTTGTISLDGASLVGGSRIVPPERRNIGVVFQDFALFPHLTVEENIAFGLNDRSAVDRRRRVQELLVMVGIGETAKRYPHEISGGQQQRVALARALAPSPAVILLDEPFSNLDHTCTHRILAETRHIIKDSGSAAIVVTHDRYEAFTLADRIAILSQGETQQIGTAETIYALPATREVAEFSGSASFIPVWTTNDTGGQWLSPLGPLPDDIAVVPAADRGTEPGASGAPKSHLAVVRPHQLALRYNGRVPKDSSTRAVVKDVRFLGSVVAVRMHVDWPASHAAADGWDASGKELLAHIGGGADEVKPGARVAVEWKAL